VGARCGESRTPGSASGLGKRTGGNADTAPQAAIRLATDCGTWCDHHESCEDFPTLPHVDPMLDHPGAAVVLAPRRDNKWIERLRHVGQQAMNLFMLGHDRSMPAAQRQRTTMAAGGPVRS
jgi:hypothetical protein